MHPPYRISYLVRILLCALLIALPASIAAIEPGDINGDGAVEPSDIFYLLKHLNGYGPAPKANADFNQDGLLDQKDIDSLTSFLFESAPLATAILDSRGGTIQARGFKLIVPAGLLAGPQQIVITSGAPPSDFLDATSDRFIIQGLPAEIASKVTISIPQHQQPAMLPALAEPVIEEYVVIKGPVLKYSKVSTVLGYYFLSAVEAVEDGISKVTTEVSNAGRWLGDKIEVFSVRRARLVSSKNKFELMVALDEWPKYKDDLTILANFLDTTYENVSNTIGLSWDLVVSPRIRVLFTSDTTREGEAVSSNWSTYVDYLTVNRQYFKEGLTPPFMATLSHEVMHLLTNQWDPRWMAQRRNLVDWWYQGNEYLWWNEAVSTWAEERIGYPGAAPSLNQAYPLSPFDGIYPTGKSKEDIQSHGYGLASMVKYMADIGTAKVVGNIYKDMRDYWLWNNGKYSIEALLDAMGSGNRNNLNWWSDYSISLMHGSIYPELPTLIRSHLKDKALSGTLVNSTWADEISSSTQASDLSATPFAVEISGGSPLESTSAVTFSALQIEKRDIGNVLTEARDAGIMVFKDPKAGPYEYLAGYHNQPIVTVDAVADGQKFLVLLFNARHVAPYSEKTNFEFQGNLGNRHFLATGGAVSFEGWLYGAKNVWNYGHHSDVAVMNAVFPSPGELVTLDVIMSLGACDVEKAYEADLEVFGKKKSVGLSCNGTPLQTALTEEVPASGEKDISVYVHPIGEGGIGQMSIGEPWF